jgi:hypothetical protein
MNVVFPKFLFIRPWPPLMFGRDPFLRMGTGCFDNSFVGYSAGIRRRGKKMGCRKNWLLWWKSKFFRHPIFLSSLRLPTGQYPNKFARHLVSIISFKLLPNIKDSRGRMNSGLLQKSDFIFCNPLPCRSYPLISKNHFSPNASFYSCRLPKHFKKPPPIFYWRKIEFH